MGKRTYSWDPEKNRINIKERQLPFEVACAAFADPHALEEPDNRENYGEERWKLTGLIAGRAIVVVCYTDRENCTHLISARKAEKYERARYYNRFRLRGR